MGLQELIEHYRVRQHSPVVARLAEASLQLGRYEDAKALCRSGLELYPSYTTLTLILARCYAAEGDFGLARELLAGVCERNPGVSSLQSLMHSWSQQDVPALPAAADQQPVRPDDVLEPEISERETDVPELPGTGEDAHAHETEEESILEQAGDVHGGGWKEPTPEPVLETPPAPSQELERVGEVGEIAQDGDATLRNDEGRIITKTLAEIYVQQGQLTEAIKTYELLKQARPPFAQEAERRIRELKGILRQE